VVVQETGTHRSERLPARGSASEDDVRIVVFVHTEETLQCRLVTDAAREFESAIVLAYALSHHLQICRVYLQLLYSEWLDVLSASNEGQQMTQRSPAKLSTSWVDVGRERRT
jgi:hypothetical protein